jgi:hypothetical protein
MEENRQPVTAGKGSGGGSGCGGELAGVMKKMERHNTKKAH